MNIRRGMTTALVSGVIGAGLVVVAPTPAHAATFDLIGSTSVHGRAVNLWRKTSEGPGLHGQIKGSPGDQVWLENTWYQVIGKYTIPNGASEVNTSSIGTYGSKFRACGKAGNRPEVACTDFGKA